MDPMRRLCVAIECGSARAFVGEDLACRADQDLGHRVDGDELFDWIENRFEPESAADAQARDRLAEFAAFVRADGGFAAMAAKLQSDLGIP